VSRCRDVVEVVARALADKPDSVRVIGRQGRTAAAMRTLVNATAELEGTKATLEFRDDE
jgi:predicted RNA-binding protein YlqC (UPF0109 family)